MLLQAVFEAGVTCWGLRAELYLCGREGGLIAGLGHNGFSL